MAKSYIKLHCDFIEQVALLTYEEVGRLVTAMLEFALGIDAPEAALTGNERFLYPTFRRQIERDNDAYAARCQQNAINGARGGRPRKTENNRTGFPKTEKSQ